MDNEAEIIKELPKALLLWYPFQSGNKMLFIKGDEQLDDSYIELFQQKGLDVCISSDASGETERFDYIFMAKAFELCKNPDLLLKEIYRKLHLKGKLLLATDNRFAIRYFCGDRDPYTSKSFDGIEGYAHLDRGERDALTGRIWSKQEIKDYIHNAGFVSVKTCSVFPAYSDPQLIISEDYYPKEPLGLRIATQYHNQDSIFLQEEFLYDSLLKNGMLHSMANGLLFECSKDDLGEFDNINQVTVSMERGKENAMFTILHKDGLVEKKPVYPEAKSKADILYENNKYLSEHNVLMVSSEVRDGSLWMPYIEGDSALHYLRQLLLTDKEEFLLQLDRYIDIIIHSSDIISYEKINWDQFEPGWQTRKADDPQKGYWRKIAFGSEEDRECLGPILERGYIDLIPINSIRHKGDFIFFDQESYKELLPAKAIILRVINFLYYYDGASLENIIPKSNLMKRYKLDRFEGLFHKFEQYYLGSLRNDDLLYRHYRSIRKDYEIIAQNRLRVNFSEEEYQRKCMKLFEDIDGKQIYLVGTGMETLSFISRFSEDCLIQGIIDLDEELIAGDIKGIPVYNTRHLDNLKANEYKIIICLPDFVRTYKLINEKKIDNWGIYDPNLTYPKIAVASKSNVKIDTGKKYRTGYVSGVFDMFHIGHLNLLRRAKEQCEYLIVGVVSDENVRNLKRTSPMISFENRSEIVGSCIYVDEVIRLDGDFAEPEEIFKRYRFDVQFVGSDYADNPLWLAHRDYLRRHGAEMVFFPYTASVSTTKLKEQLNEQK